MIYVFSLAILVYSILNIATLPGGVEGITDCDAHTCTACNSYQCKTFAHDGSYALSCLQMTTFNETIQRCTFCPMGGNCSDIEFSDDFPTASAKHSGETERASDESSEETSETDTPTSGRHAGRMRISRKCGIALCPADCEGFVLQPPNTADFEGEQCPVCRCQDYGLREPCRNNSDCELSQDCMLSRGMCRYPVPEGAVMNLCRWRWDCPEPGQYCHHESFMDLDGYCKARNPDVYRLD